MMSRIKSRPESFDCSKIRTRTRPSSHALDGWMQIPAMQILLIPGPLIRILIACESRRTCPETSPILSRDVAHLVPRHLSVTA